MEINYADEINEIVISLLNKILAMSNKETITEDDIDDMIEISNYFNYIDRYGSAGFSKFDERYLTKHLYNPAYWMDDLVRINTIFSNYVKAMNMDHAKYISIMVEFNAKDIASAADSATHNMITRKYKG